MHGIFRIKVNLAALHIFLIIEYLHQEFRDILKVIEY
jgi:hypothetical protein